MFARPLPFGTSSNYTEGLAFDSAGNLFVANAGSGNIYEFTPGGAQSTFASGLSSPAKLAFDSAGDLFEADEGSGNIYEFTPGGVQSTFASGLSKPQGLAFNSAGNLFVTDLGSSSSPGPIISSIYEFTPGGVRSTFATGSVATGMYEPWDLAFNSAGDLFVADFYSGIYPGHIYEFTPDGVRSTFASGLSNPSGLAFNSTGDLFEGEYSSGNINEFTPGGAQSTFASGLPDYGPIGLAFQPVPEPSALALLAVGVTALLVRRRKSWPQVQPPSAVGLLSYMRARKGNFFSVKGRIKCVD